MKRGLPPVLSVNDSAMVPISESPANQTLSGCSAVGTRGGTVVVVVVGAGADRRAGRCGVVGDESGQGQRRRER